MAEKTKDQEAQDRQAQADEKRAQERSAATPVDNADAKAVALAAGVTEADYDRQTDAHALDAKAQQLRAEANATTGEEQAAKIQESLATQRNAERVARGFDPMSTKAERRNQVIEAYMGGQMNYEQVAEHFDLDAKTVADIIEDDQRERAEKAS